MNSVPLADVLPWSDTPLIDRKTIVICDSTETDGRFLLHTLASQFIKSHTSDKTSTHNYTDGITAIPTSNEHNKVIWLSCGPLTEHLILSGLKKIGCDLPLSSSHRHDLKKASQKQIQVINVMLELSELFQNRHHEKSIEKKVADSDCPIFDDCHKICLKKIYKRVRTLIDEFRSNSNISNPAASTKLLVILDNVTLLSTFFGSRLVHAFIQKIRWLLKVPATHKAEHHSNNSSCLAILCSHDIDQEQYINKNSQENKNTSVSRGKTAQYIGGAGRGILLDPNELLLLEQDALYELEHGEDDKTNDNSSSCWERHLIELADGIIDVVPLASGFARDVHGRLIFTERAGSGLGWFWGRKHERQHNQRTLQHRHFQPGKGKSNTAQDRKNSGRDMKISGQKKETTFSASIVNYCCTDTGIRAIRLRASPNC